MRRLTSRSGRTGKTVGIGILTVTTCSLVVLAMQHGAASRVSADVTAGPVPTFESTPSRPRGVTIERKGDAPLSVLFAGDSLTGGLYATTEADSFRERMVDELEKGGPVAVSKTGGAGPTAVDVASNYDVPSGLDLAVVELGTNDAGKQVPEEEFRTAYTKLLDEVRTGSPDAGILCTSTWRADLGASGESSYDAIIRSTCPKFGGVYVPLRKIYSEQDAQGPAGRPTWAGTSDDWHPNDEGHARIAAILLDRIVLRDAPTD